MSLDAASLSRLLPAVYALRDAERAQPSRGWLAPAARERRDLLQGMVDDGIVLNADQGAELARLNRESLAGPLASLLAVLGEQIGVLEEDLAQLYDDQFVDTCAEWLLPYLGGLIGYRPLQQAGELVGRPRAEVAHTIAMRRRKGTLPVLEQLALDVTGWPAVAVEFFQRLITTQSMIHPRLHIAAAPDLRRWEPLLRIGTAFDTTPRTVDMRRIASGRGRHHIPNIGLFVWRLQAHALTLSPLPRVDLRRCRLHPLNIDQPLFTAPETERAITSLATPLNLPLPIARRVLAERPLDYLGDANALRSLRLFWDRDNGFGRQPIANNQIRVCHLGDDGAGWAHLPPAGFVAIDPELGRLALPPEATANWRLWASFHHGAVAEIGGGEYPRAASLSGPAPNQIVRVPDDQATIQAAINLLGGDGVVEITDSGRYAEALSIQVAADSTIELRAADGACPTLLLAGAFSLAGGDRSRVRLNGLVLSGHRLQVLAGGGNRLAQLEIVHCTLVPGWALAPDKQPLSPLEESLRITIGTTQVTMSSTICGALRIDSGARVAAHDSIIDATATTGLAYAAFGGGPGGELTLESCTVIGRVRARKLQRVSNSILLAQPAAAGEAPVRAALRQQGCIRFSWLPLASRTPRRHRCLPESAPDPMLALLRFVTLRYGEPAYLQLARSAGELLLQGADDDSEPGVYHHLHNTWRDSNLRRRLDEYLRVGLEAGVLHEN